eukprot:symbB.v1.2.038789.t2/scaffold6175.1/size20344/1
MPLPKILDLSLMQKGIIGVCASERAEASAGKYFNVSEAASNGGGAESGSNVIVPLACQSLPVRRHDVTIKTCALMGYSKQQKVVTCFRRIPAGLGNVFRP